MTERCQYCSFDPTSLSDYCDKHRPKHKKPMSDIEEIRRAAERVIEEYEGLYSTDAALARLVLAMLDGYQQVKPHGLFNISRIIEQAAREIRGEE